MRKSEPIFREGMREGGNEGERERERVCVCVVSACATVMDE
jgi:hypothetical protein